MTFGSEFEHWERFKLFLVVVGYDTEDKVLCYCSSSEKKSNGTVFVTTELCAYVKIYIYVIASEFPETALIRETPSFPAEMSIYRDGYLIEKSSHDVNQWGGATISGYRIPNS